MNILLIDDHQMFREGLSTFLLKHKKDWEITDCQSIDQGIEFLSKQSFDIIISDYHMAGKTIKDLTEYLTTKDADLPIIVISMDTDMSSLIKTLTWGVKGYISKESSSFQVLDSIEKVLEGELVFDQIMTKEIVSFLKKKPNQVRTKNRIHLKELSKREEEIFYLIIEEHDLTEISKNLFISKKTVENHRTSIYRKLGVFDKYSLHQFAVDNKLI